MEIRINTELFQNALRQYMEIVKKNAGKVVKTEAKLLAARLRQLTYPKNAKEGKDRIARDMNKVYLKNDWFENKFHFQHEELNQRVKKLVRSKDAAELKTLFDTTGRLRSLTVEQFTPERHKESRDNRGRVSNRSPHSFPVADQGDVKAFTKRKQETVGGIKGAWGRMVALLGGTTPSWLNRESGTVRDDSEHPTRPNVTLINRAYGVANLCQRTNIVQTALEGRARDLKTKMEAMLEAARRKAGL